MISVEVPAWALLFSMSHDAMKSILRFFRAAGGRPPRRGWSGGKMRPRYVLELFFWRAQHLSFFFGAAGGRPSRRGMVWRLDETPVRS